MSVPKYLETLLKNNKGVVISETDYSLYDSTQFFNRFALVIGCSKKGPINIPVLVSSPQNFEDIFGTQDMSLERKQSFFHRTVKDVLQEAPVLCLNLRLPTEIDKYNWQNISTSSSYQNSPKRSNNIQDFYDRLDGFWRRSTTEFTKVVSDNIPDANLKPLNFANLKDKKISILMFKSDLGGFDIPVEEWYNGQYPSYLHPKDYISDYMIQVIVVEGEWSNYDLLHKDNLYGNMFNKDGIKKDMINTFLNTAGVKLIKRWNVSLIPYFKDNNGNDMYIETIINNDINETGLLCSYNFDIIENDYKNGLIDLLGDNLTKDKHPQIDFLSYNKYLTDFFTLEETLLDQPGNTFGHPLFNYKGRTQTCSEGYVYGVKMKNNIISTTSTVLIKPFELEQDAYGIINGKKIEIGEDIFDEIAIYNLLENNYHRAYIILLTPSGIKFMFGEQTPLEQELYLPIIDYNNTIVLAYYEFTLINDVYNTKLTPITIGLNGFINPFNNEISFDNTPYIWLTTLRFNDIYELRLQDYKQLRLYHLWYWLSKHLEETNSIVIDLLGNKQPILWVENNNDGFDRTITIAIKDKLSNINTYGTNGMIGIYIKDIEFLAKSNKWEYRKPPLEFGTNGIIGYNSFIKESYLKGDINSGDPFFWALSEETNVQFHFDSNINQNLIILLNNDINMIYSQRKVVIDGTLNNDGLWNILETIDYGDYKAIVVVENVIEEEVDIIQIYDGEHPYIINLYEKESNVVAIVELWDGTPEELYSRLKYKDNNALWVKTLEIDTIIKNNIVIVDYNRYSNHLELGYYLLTDKKAISDNTSEVVRNWTRIVDLQRINENQLQITTDSSIRFKRIEDNIQTDILKPIYTWVDTLDFKVLEAYKPSDLTFPDGTEERQNNILNMVSNNTKMSKSLCLDKFEWRYLVDSFGNGKIQNSKKQLVDLSEQKKFALSFINTPSIKDLRNMGTTYSTDGYFDSYKFITGGDRKNNVNLGYSNVSSSYSVYLSPWIKLFENNTISTVPPASHIAQKYLRKFNDNNKEPWDVVAGIINSQITTIDGLETKYNTDDLVNMDKYGITCITNFENIYYLNNERTSEYDNSVLQNIHNREALIELEMSLYKGLRYFQWDFITNQLIISIEKYANDVCEYYKNKNAIANYTNKFISTNEMVDNQIGLLQTQVEMVGAMGTILLKIGIFKTGEIQFL